MLENLEAITVMPSSKKQSKRDWLTAVEVAEIFGVDRRTVIDWLESGKLSGTKRFPWKTSEWRIYKSSVERLQRLISKGSDLS